MRMLLIASLLVSVGCRQLFGLEDISLPIDAARPDTFVRPDGPVPPDAPPDAYMLPLTENAYIKASNTNSNDAFGNPIALSADGNYLAIGAPGEDSNSTMINLGEANEGALSSGAVYVFAWNGSAWSQQAYIKASNTEAGDAFGTSVALSSDGSTLVVGAPGEDSNSTMIGMGETDNMALGSGAVYVYTRSVTTWTKQAYLKASNTQASDAFGTSVALSGDGNTLAVGAPDEDSNAIVIDGDETNNAAADAGAVYVYTRATTTWTKQAYLKALNAGGNDQFGTSLAMSSDGNTLAVGAPDEASIATGFNGNAFDNTAFGAGAVYVFARAGTWSHQAYVKASNTEGSDQFGMAIALTTDGNALAVGAPGEDSAATGIDGAQSGTTASGSGAVYLMFRSGTTWGQEAYVKASNTGFSDDFGRAVALSPSGLHLAVGAPNEDSIGVGIGADQTSNTGSASGAVYLFYKSTAWQQGVYIKASNSQATDHFGAAVALADGAKPLVVGSPDEDSIATGVGGNPADNSLSSSGAAYSLRLP